VTLAERRTRRRRKRVAALREEGMSIKGIAAKVGASASTVHADLHRDDPERAPIANIQTADGKPVAGAEPGNTRALTHGAESEHRLAPVRERHVAELRRDLPKLDARRLALLADRLARVELATVWLDRQDGIVRNRDGEIYAVADRVERWATAAEKVLAEVEADHRRDRRFEGLDGYLDGDEEEDGDGDEG
jgi:hypothetical protein